MYKKKILDFYKKNPVQLYFVSDDYCVYIMDINGF